MVCILSRLQCVKYPKTEIIPIIYTISTVAEVTQSPMPLQCVGRSHYIIWKQSCFRFSTWFIINHISPQKHVIRANNGLFPINYKSRLERYFAKYYIHTPWHVVHRMTSWWICNIQPLIYVLCETLDNTKPITQVWIFVLFVDHWVADIEHIGNWLSMLTCIYNQM